jgi:nucleotide-binding universal stress UspA family protein
MPLELKKILVAIDGSENSDYALNLAIKIGTLYLATVDLIHVAIPTGSVVVSPRVFDPLLGTTMVLPTPKIEPGQKKQEGSGLPHILADRRQLLLEHGIQCNAIYIESDDVTGEILKATSSGGYDLTILGSRGLGGIKSLLLGSVSHKVARESKRSVLIVRTKIENVPKILLGYDGSDESKVALAFATDIGKRFHTQVTVASVVSVPIAPEGYIGSGMDRWER